MVISVSDTGVGIAAADQPRMFEQFSQVGDTLTGKPIGTGLEPPHLQASRGASRWSPVGREHRRSTGSTFSFTLPVPVASEDASSSTDAAAAAALLERAGT